MTNQALHQHIEKLSKIMNGKVTFIVLSLSATVGIMAAFQSQKWPVFSTQASNIKTQTVNRIEEQSQYTILTDEELFGRADLVFVGQVVGFSPSFWNRNNNGSPASMQEWESTPSDIFYQVQLKVIKPILGAKVGQVINVTKLGASPVKSTVKIGKMPISYAESEENVLKIGSKGVFLLATKAKNRWVSSSGKLYLKPMISFAAPLFQSYLPEKNEMYTLNSKSASLDLVQSKVRLYESARGKELQKIEKIYSLEEKQFSRLNKK